MFTKPFTELGKGDAATAGGKGASLGEMTQAGIPVPPGYVVLADSFEHFLEETDLNVEVDAIIDSVNHKDIASVEHASEKIQALILAAKMPSDIEQEIESEFKKLGAKYVAVRSSATAEDSSAAAWAGQLDSYLNTTEDNLLEKVKHCWASLFTPRAIFYRFEKGLHTTKISVAVVVQKMVASEVSGIAFSVHPVTEDRNQLIIEAGFGLGEAIVSGQITPDSYVVEKEPRRIIDTNIATQLRGIYRKGESGNEWRDISESEGAKQKLSNEQILELSIIIMRIENHYAFPCDIEWAWENNTFYIVQSRPITTLPTSNISAPIRLSKIYSRKKTLLYFSVWDEADVRGCNKYIGTPLTFSLFLLPPKGEHEVWYSTSEISSLEKLALDKLRSNPDLIEEISIDLTAAWDRLRIYFMPGKQIESVEEAKTYYESLVSFWTATNTIFFELPNHPGVPKRFSDAILSIREATQEFTDEMSEKFVKFVERTYPMYSKYASVVTFADIETLNKKPKKEFLDMLDKRKDEGCMLFHNQVYPLSDLVGLSLAYNFELERVIVDSSTTEIKGSAGYSGIATGRVRIVLGKDDLPKIEAGDILVAPMTKVDYVSAMKLAAAFVTDEGGITCHAAIVARELKKPCVIGTKNATQVLKDGDMVEVDADNGVVRKL